MNFLECCQTSIFSHPDYTVGFGISPNHAYKRLTGLEIYKSHYRRSGITPCPEDRSYLYFYVFIIHSDAYIVKKKAIKRCTKKMNIHFFVTGLISSFLLTKHQMPKNNKLTHTPMTPAIKNLLM